MKAMSEVAGLDNPPDDDLRPEGRYRRLKTITPDTCGPGHIDRATARRHA